MGKSNDDRLAVIQGASTEAALRNSGGVWPPRIVNVSAEKIPNSDKPVEASGVRSDLSSDSHLTRTGKIQRKLEALRLKQELCESRDMIDAAG